MAIGSELGASWSELEWGGSKGSDLGVRGASFSLLPCCPLAPCPQRWWRPQYIVSCSLDIGARSSEVGVRGVTAGTWEWGEWSGSEGSQLQLPPCPLAPCPQEVVGTQIHTNLFIGIWEWGLVSWEWGEWQEPLGIEGSDLGVRGASFSLLPPCPLAPCPPRGGGDPNTY